MSEECCFESEVEGVDGVVSGCAKLFGESW